MPKVLNTLATLVLLSFLTIPYASFAHEHEEETDTTVSTENVEQEHDELTQRHNEIEENYENYEGVVIPPVIMNMGKQENPDSYILPILPTGEEQSQRSNFIGQQIGVIGTEQVEGFDPYKLDPLPVKGLVLTTVTPADEFMDGARTLVIGLGIAAFGLLGLVSFGAYRSKRTKSNNL